MTQLQKNNYEFCTHFLRSIIIYEHYTDGGYY
jgi:hypothetical protein